MTQKSDTECLETLVKSGQLGAEDLVKLAEPKDSPIHHLFEWDDEKAARAWREASKARP